MKSCNSFDTQSRSYWLAIHISLYTGPQEYQLVSLSLKILQRTLNQMCVTIWVNFGLPSQLTSLVNKGYINGYTCASQILLYFEVSFQPWLLDWTRPDKKTCPRLIRQVHLTTERTTLLADDKYWERSLHSWQLFLENKYYNHQIELLIMWASN